MNSMNYGTLVQVFLKIPEESYIYTIRCNMIDEPNPSRFGIEMHITDELNVTYNSYNASVSYDNNTGWFVTSAK